VQFRGIRVPVCFLESFQFLLGLLQDPESLQPVLVIRGKSQKILTGSSSSEGNPGPKYVAYILIFCQSTLVEGQKICLTRA